MRVCYFGTYSVGEGYPRNKVIIDGLKKNGVDVVECHEDLWESTSEKITGIKNGFALFRKIFDVLKVYARLVRKFRAVDDYDVMVVGYAGHIDVFLAKLLSLFRKKPLVFDAFLSLYDTAVVDRRLVSPHSLKAKLLRLLDKWSCRIADVVFLDTQAHIDYFKSEFNLPPHKFVEIPVGSSFSYETPMSRELTNVDWGVNKDKFDVLYFGSYIPLHGVDVILNAARILQGEKDVVFTLIGVGQLLPEMNGLASVLKLDNVTFVDRFVKEDHLMQYISKADVCLGIFGSTNKAQRVIPCKVYNCLAMGKPLITARTPATERVLTNMENAFLCRPGDPEALAEAILFLRNNKSLSDRIGQAGGKYFLENLSVGAIGQRVIKVLEGLK